MSVIEDLTNEDIDIINETENTLNCNEYDKKPKLKKEKIKRKVKNEKTIKPKVKKIDEVPVLGWW
jgi:hypothetical protein